MASGKANAKTGTFDFLCQQTSYGFVADIRLPLDLGEASELEHASKGGKVKELHVSEIQRGRHG